MPAKIAFVIATTATAISNLDSLFNAAGILGAKSAEITDANRQRIVNWINAQYDPGNTLTDAQAANEMAEAVLRGVKENVLNGERAAVESTASDGVSDIPI